MNKHPLFGISIPEKTWVPAPRYLLRRDRILQLMRSLPKGDLLEIGCGSGALLNDLAKMGFYCKGIEISAAALEIARTINRENLNVSICRKAQEGWQFKFDYVMAFEVLEHIEDDLGSLKQWASFLKPNGHLLLSVPAHPKRWNSFDIWAGHLRRYERKGLERLLENAGFVVREIECYGFPLGNILEPIRTFHYGRLFRQEPAVPSEQDQCKKNTMRSGVERPLENKLYHLQASWVGTQMMQFFCFIQRWFARSELGNGYIALSKLQ